MKNKKIDLLKITTFALLALLIICVALYLIFAEKIVDMNTTPDNSAQNFAEGLGFAILLVLLLYANAYDAIVQLAFGIVFCTVKKAKAQKICLIVYIVLHAIFIPALLYIVVVMLASFKLPFLVIVATVALVGLALFNLVLPILALSKPKQTTATIQ